MQILEFRRVREKFRELERKLTNIKYPQNEANKRMSLLLSSISSFEIVMTRYKNDRGKLQVITNQAREFWRSNSHAKSMKAHPDENYISRAIRVDAESLFIFGLILVNRSLLLTELFLKDKPNKNVFNKLTLFYKWLAKNQKTELASKLAGKISNITKWLYATLRFYRNEFVEHLDRPYQLGFVHSVARDSFTLSAYKWNYNHTDTLRVNKFKKKLLSRNIDFSRELNPRHYVQLVFNNIISVPNDLLEEALTLIEDVGGESPEPNLLINKIDEYLYELLDFMIVNFDKSAFVKHE